MHDWATAFIGDSIPDPVEGQPIQGEVRFSSRRRVRGRGPHVADGE